MGRQQAMVTRDRYVVLVVGPEAAGWVLPGVETVCCGDADEAVVWLEGSRPWSALVVGRGHDRLREAAGRLGIPVATLPGADVAAFLRERAKPIRSADDLGRCGAALSWWRPEPPRGAVVTVCGPGGTGVSTVAMAVTAALASRPASLSVVLADFALRAGQAILHHVEPTSVGLEELVDAHRSRRLSPAQVRAGTLAVDSYRLLVGLHRPFHWTVVRPAAFDAALESLRATFSVVVADVTGDLEGEAETGSADIEERNHMARRTIASSDVVVVVGAPGPTGRWALDAAVEAVADHLGDADRTVRVLNGPDTTPREADTIAVGPLLPTGDLAGWGEPIADAVGCRLGADSVRRPPKPTLVARGSIGHWQGAR